MIERDERGLEKCKAEWQELLEHNQRHNWHPALLSLRTCKLSYQQCNIRTGVAGKFALV